MMKILVNIFTILGIIATIIGIIFSIMFGFNSNDLAAKQLSILENTKKEVPEKIKEKIKENQYNGKNVSIYSTGSTKVISINYGEKKEKLNFFISIINNSDLIFGNNGYGQYINVVFPEQNLIIDGVDLKKGEYIKKIDLKIENGGKISDKIYFSLSRVGLNFDLTYPSIIKLYLTYNDGEPLDNDYEIILLRSNISLINSSGVEGLTTKYYNIFKNQHLGQFGIQRVNNRIEKTLEYVNKDKFTQNEIWYTEERYKTLAEYINENLFNNSFILKELSVDDCNKNIIDNRLELLKKEVNGKIIPVEYLFDGGILPSDYSLCKVSNIMFNLVN